MVKLDTWYRVISKQMERCVQYQNVWINVINISKPKHSVGRKALSCSVHCTVNMGEILEQENSHSVCKKPRISSKESGHTFHQLSFSYRLALSFHRHMLWVTWKRFSSPAVVSGLSEKRGITIFITLYLKKTSHKQSKRNTNIQQR